MKFCSEVFACVLVMVRNKKSSKSVTFTGSKQIKTSSSWLFGCYALGRLSSPKMSMVGKSREVVFSRHIHFLCPLYFVNS